VIVFGGNRELLEICIAKELKFCLILTENGIISLLRAIKSNFILFSFYSSILNKKLYISQLYPQSIKGVV